MQRIIKSSNIISVKYYDCGYCTNNLKLVFKNYKKEIRKFPAGVFLIEHRDLGFILIDTGYSNDMFDKGFIPKVYKQFNPTFCKEEDEISFKLKNDGINLDDIKIIILTHLHPDHIGCLKKFINAKIYISSEMYSEYKKNNLKSLIFKNLIPDDFENRIHLIEFNTSNKCVSFLNNDDISLINLNGHAKGQIGVYLKNDNILLAADSCWGNDLLNVSKNMKIIGKLIQNNMKEYIQSLDLINEFKSSNVKVYFSHDKITRKELLNKNE